MLLLPLQSLRNLSALHLDFLALLPKHPLRLALRALLLLSLDLLLQLVLPVLCLS
jgi:hypothetical protein